METETSRTEANQGWPTTAAEARRLGVRYCYTGKPCAKCGRIGLRRARNSDCYFCVQDWSREHAKKRWAEGRPAWEAKREEERPAREAAAAERRRISEETKPQRAAARKVKQQQREVEQRRAWIEEHEEDTDGWYEELAVPAKAKYWRDPEKQRARRRERTCRGCRDLG